MHVPFIALAAARRRGRLMAGIAFSRLLLLLCYLGHPSEACTTKAGSCIGLEGFHVVYCMFIVKLYAAGASCSFQHTNDSLKAGLPKHLK